MQCHASLWVAKVLDSGSYDFNSHALTFWLPKGKLFKSRVVRFSTKRRLFRPTFVSNERASIQSAIITTCVARRICTSLDLSRANLSFMVASSCQVFRIRLHAHSILADSSVLHCQLFGSTRRTMVDPSDATESLGAGLRLHSVAPAGAYVGIPVPVLDPWVRACSCTLSLSCHFSWNPSDSTVNGSASECTFYRSLVRLASEGWQEQWPRLSQAVGIFRCGLGGWGVSEGGGENHPKRVHSRGSQFFMRHVTSFPRPLQPLYFRLQQRERECVCV